MKHLKTSEELMEFVIKMNQNHSIEQFYIPGKGTFAVVLQAEEPSIQADVEANPELKQMIANSRKEYAEGLGLTTSDLLRALSPKDFQ